MREKRRFPILFYAFLMQAAKSHPDHHAQVLHTALGADFDLEWTATVLSRAGIDLLLANKHIMCA